jgi:hypothetical protein
MSEDAEFVSSDVEKSAALAVNELLPVKSRKKYDKAYQQLEDWCREKRVRDITEEVLLAYFKQKSRKLKGSTLWRTLQTRGLISLSRFQTLKQTSGENLQYHQAILKVWIY